jgi:hypothetical protein
MYLKQSYENILCDTRKYINSVRIKKNPLTLQNSSQIEMLFIAGLQMW